ncbi:MAG: FAD-dependent monooxygenase [Chamaesiphon sp.]|nr:FAD-dependent monooxygenase [Chamaesiphon sp.]
METTTTTQVIIVSAGPTGLSLAAQLIRYGINFVIFDRNPDRIMHPCGSG